MKERWYGKTINSTKQITEWMILFLLHCWHRIHVGRKFVYTYNNPSSNPCKCLSTPQFFQIKLWSSRDLNPWWKKKRMEGISKLGWIKVLQYEMRFRAHQDSARFHDVIKADGSVIRLYGIVSKWTTPACPLSLRELSSFSKSPIENLTWSTVSIVGGEKAGEKGDCQRLFRFEK